MKILLLLEATLGGTARHILDLSDGLLERGHDVHLLYSDLRASKAFDQGLHRLKTRPRFTSLKLSIRRELGFSDIQAYRDLSRYVATRGPFDILHSHSTKAGFLLRLLLNRQGAASIYTPHGLMTQNPELKGIRRWAVSSLESALARLCDRVVAVSRVEQLCAIAAGICPSKITVIHNGLSPTEAPHRERREEIRRRLGLTPETVCIGAIGLLTRNKAHSRLVEAFTIIKDDLSVPVRILIIGWGPEEFKLREQIAGAGLSKSVELLGQVSGAEYLPAFDIFAHTSHFEGFGYTFLEAIHARVPILTTQVGGAQETIQEGVNGHIVDPWNSDTFAEVLRRLIETPSLRSSMGAAALLRSPAFSASAMVESTLTLYKQVRKLQTHGEPQLVGASTPRDLS